MTDNEKRIPAFILAVVVALCLIPVAEDNAANSGYTYTVLSDGTCEITGYSGSDTKLPSRQTSTGTP